MRNQIKQFSPFADSRDDAHFDNLRAEVLQMYGVDLDLIGGRSPIGNQIDPARMHAAGRLPDARTAEEQARMLPQAIANPGIYGDMVQLLVPLAANTEGMVLARPNNKRVFLFIQNNNPLPMYMSFDQIASPSGWLIPAGGNVMFDAAVPQNDVHIAYSLGGGAIFVPIFYINSDIAAPR